MKKQYFHESKIPDFPESYWLASTTLPDFTKLTQDVKVDAAIVGAGITGILTAYLLSKKGLKVALVEAGHLLSGTTKHTTAKITAQHDLIYSELLSHFGKEKAIMYYDANREAMEFIKKMVREQEILCDLMEEDAYIYTSSNAYVSKLTSEIQAYEALGIPGTYVEQTLLPFSVEGAIVMPKQAHFHPAAFIVHMVKEVIRLGGDIYENTTAISADPGTTISLTTSEGYKITADYIVSCSHFPFYDGGGFYFSRLHAERSYVLLAETEKAYPQGMYLSAEEPKRSLRPITVDGKRMVLIGGESHKTGQGICTIKHYEALQQFGEETFGLKEIHYRWSAQDLISLDKIPYVGPIASDKPNILVATGYKKWGMTSSVAAALLNSRLILGEDTLYSELFTPSRFHTDPDIKTFLIQNADAAGHFIAGKLEMVHQTTEELQNDEGAVVRVHGKRAGAYRDPQGKLHVVDTTCTHMGCEVEWNAGERTWDCPCHGSRFSYEGDVLEGPAAKSLRRIESY
ncbi:FAD-dependent oxidoreductase [Paenibacillus tyrfis]|uniref:(2Fe-2S)-binding protein n=1 Tax=Paenibacillus tyrfis TaxID=1501230 RepID=A0A081NXH5_9BACL|nr:FAD-dependent oxidoreductase [Paenibacillus tyrfis]KEQ23148.1 (2Fe-2S)-binding protein [Paenibacillus tyrfis]